MSATLLYRIAAIILILFAAGHTFGFLKFKPPNPEGVAVRDAMDSVHLQVGSGKVTYGDFYRGFGLFCSVYLLFAAYVAWYLGGMAKSNPQAVASLAWVFFALQIVGLVLSWIYFLPPPVVLSALVAICTGWAAWLVSTAKA
jgi:hypothetical protein